MKNMKIQTKLIIGFSIIGLLLIITLYPGYTLAHEIINSDNPERFLSNYAIFTMILFVVEAVMTTGISVGVTRTIRTSTKKLSDVSKQVALGKVDIKIEKTSNDEFGELMDEYQKVIDNIRYQATIAEKVSEGNLTVDIKPRSEDDILGIAIRKLIRGNHNSVTNVSDAANQVMTSASQVASASESLAQGSTEQASAIEQITASIDDVAEKTKKNADEASTASELISNAIFEVKQGNEQMRDMMSAMQAINDASASISKIIKVIDDIAFQTNILALNAAVEAARAGDAGKGFAVVAEEVRNLAAKSAAAAAETAELIEDSMMKVEAGSKIADDTAKALAAITDVVQQSEYIIKGIAEASNYQATAIAQIDQAVGQVSEVVQTNSATSQECAAASEELFNQANRMTQLLSVYKLKNNGSKAMDMSSDYYDNDVRGYSDKNEQIISLGDGFGKY